MRSTVRAVVFLSALLGLEVPSAAVPGGEPDGCDGDEAVFLLDAEGAKDGQLEVTVRPGEAGELRVDVLLRMSSKEAKTTSGWALSVAHEMGETGTAWLALEDVSTEGTFREELHGVLEVTEPASDGASRGFVSSVFATCGVAPCLVEPRGEYLLARARYRYRVPEDLEALGGSLRAAIRFRDGLQGSGKPVANVLSLEGESRVPCTREIEVTFRLPERRPFFRGDANFDAALDISDPVTVLHALFEGDAVIRCQDAADGNDDGAVDVSDAAYVFQYLFTGGPPPPSPFPAPGEDPTEDSLDCRP